jgi:hypothetical protein
VKSLDTLVALLLVLLALAVLLWRPCAPAYRDQGVEARHAEPRS